MKLDRVIVIDEQGQEIELKVQDGAALLICEDGQILTQNTQNAAINLELARKILAPIVMPQEPVQE